MLKIYFLRVLMVWSLIALFTGSVKSQLLVEMIDTTTREGKGIWLNTRNLDHLKISGYIQPQYQVAGNEGINSYSGGDFPEKSNNRFMFRRSRIRFDYAHFTEKGLPVAQFVFQLDGTERGVAIRDIWGRIYENEWQLFSLTTGMFARPFGYEVNLSSGDRETPERGRMSQILMKTERDLGAMISFEPRKGNNPFRLLKLDLGIFNGQGMAGPSEYDNYKDIISRLSLKPFLLNRNLNISAGISYLNGGIVQNNSRVYSAIKHNKSFSLDSSERNIGDKLPRKYHGADLQLKWKHAWGNTIFRGEYWWGTQTGTLETSETPAGLLINTPYYIRPFNGAFFYLLQNIVNDKHQVGIKYDFYDPNTSFNGIAIGNNAANTGAADVKFSTVSIGYNFYYSKNIKLLLWYDMVENERTSLDGLRNDIDDNVLTCRVQYTF